MTQQWAGPEGHWAAGSGQNHRAPAPAPYPPAAAPYPYGPARVPATGPPARVGAAVAALVCALLTLVFPVLLSVLFLMPLLMLLSNVPGIIFGIMGLRNPRDPETVERFIGYTWGCTMIYLALYALAVVGVIALSS